MKVKNSQFMIATLALSLAAVSGYAQSQPSAKVTAKVGYINVVSETSAGVNQTNTSATGWQTIMKNNIKTANQKDLFVSPSLEVGLLTDTLVRSKNGVPDSSWALAGVQVRVLVDGAEMLPGAVTYGRRAQTLTATFQGIIDGCLAIDPLTGGIVIDPACVQPEVLQLILDTMSANSFNFIKADLPSGVHTVEVQARIDLGASAQLGSARARALIGNGSVTVESVRMIKGEDITSLP